MLAFHDISQRFAVAETQSVGFIGKYVSQNRKFRRNLDKFSTYSVKILQVILAFLRARLLHKIISLGLNRRKIHDDFTLNVVIMPNLGISKPPTGASSTADAIRQALKDGHMATVMHVFHHSVTQRNVGLPVGDLLTFSSSQERFKRP